MTTLQIFDDRVERIKKVMDSEKLSVHDTENMLGSASFHEKPMRYVVMAESSKGHGRFLNGASNQDDACEIAAASVQDAWLPLIERRTSSDDRLPVRYDTAGVKTIVMFDSKPS
jgi:hypothetical protein